VGIGKDQVEYKRSQRMKFSHEIAMELYDHALMIGSIYNLEH